MMEPTRPPIQPPERPTFERELEALVNKYSFDDQSNTPDFILADFIMRCLKAWHVATAARDKWFQPTNVLDDPPIKGSI